VDIIISSAGVSVGAFDYVKSVVEADGELDFWKVNMRLASRWRLGNISAFLFRVARESRQRLCRFRVFYSPGLEQLSGQTPHPHPSQKARLAERSSRMDANHTCAP